jgi:hypothetical protein
VVLIESFRDWLFKRRNEFVEQPKQKIEIMSKPQLIIIKYSIFKRIRKGC